ncbi:MAG TPA: glycosyltransferase [Chitinophagaceae bacterium]|nr:glycosyltransferase [Chitinophagaceae bacterium]
MPSAVLDLDLAHLPEHIGGLHAYTRAFILIRYKSKPIGNIWVPLYRGQLKPAHVYPDMIEAVAPELKKAWLHEYLQWDERDVTGFIPPSATVAICTRNRTPDLQRCLEALMKLHGNGHEILVIDNCPSNDDTKHLVALYPGVKYILEERPGLDIARNTALKAAAGEIVAFTDDDAVPDAMWLHNLLKNFNDKQVMCVTGMTMPLELETEAQEAFEQYSPFGKGFTRKVYASDTHNPLAVGQIGAGANMAFRRSVLEAVGHFDEALDAGTPTESGGDHEFFARILLAGYTIVYDPQALNWHRHRRTWTETKKAIRGYGIGVYAFWTRLLVKEKQSGIIKFTYGWFFGQQLPNIVRSMFGRPGSHPLHLLLAELKGCALGPWKYYSSRRRLKRTHVNV